VGCLRVTILADDGKKRGQLHPQDRIGQLTMPINDVADTLEKLILCVNNGLSSNSYIEGTCFSNHSNSLEAFEVTVTPNPLVPDEVYSQRRVIFDEH